MAILRLQRSTVRREASDLRVISRASAFINLSEVPHVLRDITSTPRYLHPARSGVTREVAPMASSSDNAPMGISLVASTGSVTMLPPYVQPLLPWTVVSRPMKGKQPTIDLAVGYRTDNHSECSGNSFDPSNG